MGLYRLSKEAEKDLEDLWVYLAERNDTAGDLQVAKLLDRIAIGEHETNVFLNRRIDRYLFYRCFSTR